MVSEAGKRSKENPSFLFIRSVSKLPQDANITENKMSLSTFTTPRLIIGGVMRPLHGDGGVLNFG